MIKKINNQFHIQNPFWSAWQKYGWKKDDWGLGLEKNRIDFLASQDAEAVVSYYKSEKQYTISAKMVQEYPMERIKDFNTFVYIVKKSALKTKPMTYAERKKKKNAEAFAKYNAMTDQEKFNFIHRL